MHNDKCSVLYVVQIQKVYRKKAQIWLIICHLQTLGLLPHSTQLMACWTGSSFLFIIMAHQATVVLVSTTIRNPVRRKLSVRTYVAISLVKQNHSSIGHYHSQAQLLCSALTNSYYTALAHTFVVLTKLPTATGLEWGDPGRGALPSAIPKAGELLRHDSA